jgi:hypothetical protein
MNEIIKSINRFAILFWGSMCFLAGFYLAVILHQKIQIKPMYPQEAQTKIVQIRGIDWRFAWWRHGPFRLAEIEAAQKIAASKLREIAR